MKKIDCKSALVSAYQALKAATEAKRPAADKRQAEPEDSS
jgi:hypothetical protein